MAFEQLRRKIGNASQGIREARRERKRKRNTLGKRQKLDDELAKKSKVLEARLDELQKLLEERPEREDELREKIEEIKAERGDIRDRRNQLRKSVFPKLRDQIANRIRRIRGLRKHRHKLREELEDRKDDRKPPPDTDGLSTIDGRQVASWMYPWIVKIRARGRWGGYVVSGYRTPEYSIKLCMARCGQPSCPGTCAGAASNHSGKVFPAGAIDVSDYYVFAAEARAIGAPFYNALGAQDPVHFSNSGR